MSSRAVPSHPSFDIKPQDTQAIGAESAVALNGPVHTDITAITEELLATLREALTSVGDHEHVVGGEPGARLGTAKEDPQEPELLDTLEHAHMARERVQRGLRTALVAFDHNIDAAFATLREDLLAPRPDGFLDPTVERASAVSGQEAPSPPDTAVASGVGNLAFGADPNPGPQPHSSITRLVEQLSAREVAVLEFLPSCLTNREIAAELFVSKNTVKAHEKSIYRKLGVNSRRQAVDIARTHQLI